MKNEANLKAKYLIVTTCSRVGYNVFRPKTQNGTKPNEANFRRSRRSLGEDGCQLLAHRPVGVVQPANTLHFSGIPANPQNLFLRNKANFNNLKSAVTSYIADGYNGFQTETQNGTKPNKANFQNEKIPIFQKTKKWKTNPIKANFRGLI
jgi:hypothetical protein